VRGWEKGVVVGFCAVFLLIAGSLLPAGTQGELNVISCAGSNVSSELCAKCAETKPLVECETAYLDFAEKMSLEELGKAEEEREFFPLDRPTQKDLEYKEILDRVEAECGS